ncbi:MAG TPA: FdtA/QdtA family cupin domain-containing protein [Candidatus Gastranaerophilaceae bacterium]|nr:FdtA/QdtA family cupin domain-containing protein [Candidatus Gastranaerophilaceae bacterium]
MNYKLIDFVKRGDKRGSLVAIEGNQDIPFEIKRVFYIFDTQGQDVIRGDHANRKSKFVLVMVSGSCKIKVFSDKEKFEIIELNSPDKGLFLDTLTWKEMYDFSPNSVMLVLASEHFDADEYISSHQELLDLIN